MDYYVNKYAKLIASALNHELPLNTIIEWIETPKFSHLGDLAFPCFTLAKLQKRAPHLIAQEFASQIYHSDFSKFEANGPYINAFINRDHCSQTVINEILELKEHYGDHHFGDGKTITFDLSSPNIAKPFSMGHLRSTVIGQAIANLAEKCGYHAVRINYIGDWGTQFGKLIAAYKKWGSEEAVKSNPISELFKLYTKFHDEADKDPQLNDEGRYWFLQLEQGNVEAVKLWKWFKDVSLEAFEKIYQLLNIHFDSMKGESFYNDKMAGVVAVLEEKELLEESEGALVVRLDDTLPPALIKKKDGATLYATRDLASAIYRKNIYQFDYSFYVVGNEQSLHFNQLKQVLQKMGYDWATNIEHVPFGMILKDGKKMSTRKGKVVLLEKVLEDIIAQANTSISEKNPDLQNKEMIAQQVGVGAVIYHDLKHYRRNDVEFSLVDMLKFEGNTGPYIQYTHARACSILRKFAHEPQLITSGMNDDLSWELIMQLAQFPHQVKQAFMERDPSLIAKMIYKLAQSYNQYYAHTRILDGENLQVKIALTQSVTIVLKEGLRLLGIEAPEEM
mgnify:CR=1 FL=1